MRKLTLSFMVLFAVTLLSSCDDIPDSNLERHIDTMDSMQTYVIEIASKKDNGVLSTTKNNYVYIDNIHSTFLVRNNNNTKTYISNEDIVFEYDDNMLYGYVYDDVWRKYEVDSSYLNIKYFESVLYTFFTESETITDDGYVVYQAYLNLDDLEGRLYNFTTEDMPKEYYGTDFLVQAYYSIEDQMFTSFTFDLSDIYADMEGEEGNVNSGVSWIVEFAFDEFNDDFSVNLDNYVYDDYLNSFNHVDMFDFDSQFSYEMVKGTVDYTLDQDILRIEFEETGIYKLMLTNISSLSELKITILDANYEVYREEVVDFNHMTSGYWNYPKGLYYIIVSSSEIDFIETTYSFLFVSN